jgi:outer membrane protein assembly factor BamE (lipoprotein component of BamABCDE complex)
MRKLHCLTAVVSLLLLGALGPSGITSAEKAVSTQALPGPADASSLGFSSSAEDVLRLAGRPTRVAAVGDDDVWFYGLSTITIHEGAVAGWTQFDRRLPLNIGSPASVPTAAGPGRTVAQVVAALGTPKAVVGFEEGQIWFYGGSHLILYRGRVTPWEELPGAQAANRSRILRGSPASTVPSVDSSLALTASARGPADPARPSVSQLWGAYMGNGLAAEAAYTGSVLTVEGAVGTVDRETGGAPYVLLTPSAEISAIGVRCQFGKDDEAKLRPLKAGQSVKIRGKCAGRSGTDVVLTDCSLQP